MKIIKTGFANKVFDSFEKLEKIVSMSKLTIDNLFILTDKQKRYIIDKYVDNIEV